MNEQSILEKLWTQDFVFMPANEMMGRFDTIELLVSYTGYDRTWLFAAHDNRQMYLCSFDTQLFSSLEITKILTKLHKDFVTKTDLPPDKGFYRIPEQVKLTLHRKSS